MLFKWPWRLTSSRCSSDTVWQCETPPSLFNIPAMSSQSLEKSSFRGQCQGCKGVPHKSCSSHFPAILHHLDVHFLHSISFTSLTHGLPLPFLQTGSSKCDNILHKWHAVGKKASAGIKSSWPLRIWECVIGCNWSWMFGQLTSVLTAIYPSTHGSRKTKRQTIASFEFHLFGKRYMHFSVKLLRSSYHSFIN